MPRPVQIQGRGSDEAQKWLASIVSDRPSWVEERVTQRYLNKFKSLFSEKGFNRLPKRH